MFLRKITSLSRSMAGEFGLPIFGAVFRETVLKFNKVQYIIRVLLFLCYEVSFVRLAER